MSNSLSTSLNILISAATLPSISIPMPKAINVKEPKLAKKFLIKEILTMRALSQKFREIEVPERRSKIPTTLNRAVNAKYLIP